jgi:hypothetical protein
MLLVQMHIINVQITSTTKILNFNTYRIEFHGYNPFHMINTLLCPETLPKGFDNDVGHTLCATFIIVS